MGVGEVCVGANERDVDGNLADRVGTIDENNRSTEDFSEE